VQEVGVTFCNDDGTLRYKDLDGLSEADDSEASRGGFLHIEMVSIREEHRHRDLGVRCIKRLLEWLNARDARERQEHRQASLASQPPTDGDEGAFLLWMNSRKYEYQYLHAGWTIAVLQPGVENTDADHERARALAFGEAGDTEEDAERNVYVAAVERKVPPLAPPCPPT